MSNKVIVGFFLVHGVGPDSVEVPCTGRGPVDYAELDKAIRLKHPKVQPRQIQRIASVIEIRDGTNDYVELFNGATIGQIFQEGEGEAARVIGSTFFSGAPFNIVLIISRGAGTVSVELRGRVLQEGVIRLPGKISPQRLASELPQLVREMLGSDAIDIKLKLRETKPQTKV